jgi:methionyl-tRNA formyltransferase
VRIAFFGLPLAALLLERDGHEIVLAAICRPDALGLRRLRDRENGCRLTISVAETEKPGFARQVREVRPDLVVSWFWTKRLPPAILALAPAIGVHPSLLPRHRGPDPYFWAIRSGDAVTGVTAHVLDESYDTGPILGRRTLPIDPRWNAWTLARKLDRPSLALLREVVSAYARGKPPAPESQDDRHATAAPEPDDETLAIRWRESAADAARLVRAASPWPGAFTEIGGEMVALTRVAITTDFPRALEPGEAWVRPDGTAVVRAGDGALELLEGRIDLEPGEQFLDRKGLGELLGGRQPVA